jgi:MurNAc alpha-1-phosphate uridylyltransferase
MADTSEVAAVVLAAGAGSRLAPLTRLRPKPLCPVGNEALLDLALARVAEAVPAGATAVNVHHHRDQMEAHLETHPGVHVSVEADRALGTAGALGHLRGWIAGRGVLVVNADSWSTAPLAPLTAGWDGDRVRMLVAGDAPFGPSSAVVASLLPWSAVEGLEPVPSGLFEVCWRDHLAAGAIETVASHEPFVDCGTPADYLRANLLAALLIGGGSGASVVAPDAEVMPGAAVEASVVGSRAVIGGALSSSVVWDDAQVHPHERLHRAIRADARVTVLVR